MKSGLVILSAAASLGAAAIHLALGPHHVEELGAVGLGFYLAGGLQLALAGSLVLWRGRPARELRAIILAGVGLNVAILAAWSASRVVGLPAGPAPWQPEAIGLADAVSAAFEVLVLASALVLLRTSVAPPGRRPGARHPISAIVVVPAVALIAFTTGLALFSPDGVAGHGRSAGDGHSHGSVHAPPHIDRPTEPQSHTAPAATAGPPAAVWPAPTASPIPVPALSSDSGPWDHEHGVSHEGKPHAH